jgi:hypothetical protein
MADQNERIPISSFRTVQGLGTRFEIDALPSNSPPELATHFSILRNDLRSPDFAFGFVGWQAAVLTDQEQVLDEVMTLIGEQVIDATHGMESASTRTAAAWLLLRRPDQRRFDQRTAIFEAQAGKARDTGEDAPLPPMDNEERERRYRQILGMEPL